MKVEIVETHGVLFAGDADSVIVPAADGDLGILPGRQPVLATLREGKVRIKHDGTTESFDVVAGFVSVDDDLVQVVVDNTKPSQNEAKELAEEAAKRDE
ncbi:hypothetical protein BSZ39_05335 [Bowdeniella nasicola]|uniref:ATP synthase F1 complex delta/epsilon subunit N-terminal domain-containing protein n=1 Tax=Bowdeniella nasicola TaxID=208480 RepID=A0A1Q5Q2Z0_9ACTO|nr:F0F1 ATP synthase subunit epsilon [Bowdeniella nasicola]OKL54201.1 hypothetical protein BSZ39_05335 [Bowdeniella nasicola]